MHVLQVTPRYFPNIGGVEVVVQKLSEELVARKIKVTVYSIDLDSCMLRQQEINGVSVKRFAPLYGDPLYLPEPIFLWSLRRENAEIIHVHNMHTLLPLLAMLLKQRKQKLLLQPHYHRFGQSFIRNCLLNLYRHLTADLIISRIDAVIVNSFYENKIFCEDYARYKNVILIPEGVDVEELKHVKRNPTEPKRVLYVGALRKYKNVDKILEGFARLIEKGYNNFKLVIVGEGPEHAFLVRQSLKLGLEPFVEWKYNLTRKELLHEYARASVFVHLSPLESFSRVVYEALSLGVPAVVLNYGATAHLVKDGFAEGVNSLNPEEIAEAILSATEKTYKKISDESSATLNWNEYTKKVISVYHQLMEKY